MQIDLPVELLFRRAVGETAVAEAAEVAVEFRTDVPEFVDHGIEFFPERQVEEAGQIKVEDIEHILAVMVFYLLHPPSPPAAHGMQTAAGKTQRSERGINSRSGAGIGLEKN